MGLGSPGFAALLSDTKVQAGQHSFWKLVELIHIVLSFMFPWLMPDSQIVCKLFECKDFNGIQLLGLELRASGFFALKSF